MIFADFAEVGSFEKLDQMFWIRTAQHNNQAMTSKI
jgi:hypothetical protein